MGARVAVAVTAMLVFALGIGVALAVSNESRSFAFPIDQTVMLQDGSTAHLSGNLNVDVGVIVLDPPPTTTEPPPTTTDTTPTTTTTDTTPTPPPGSVSVATSGNDSICGRGNGIACLTFQRAYQVAERGDIVTVESGIYLTPTSVKTRLGV